MGLQYGRICRSRSEQRGHIKWGVGGGKGLNGSSGMLVRRQVGTR